MASMNRYLIIYDQRDEDTGGGNITKPASGKPPLGKTQSMAGKMTTDPRIVYYQKPHTPTVSQVA